ncbi:MAG: efflux RND transporter permease subunit, partial [Terriglobia bacterium]
ITRYLEKGMAPFQAALKGAQEIGFTVLTMSISLVAVFIPLLLMGGIVGRLFREFAVTLSAAILVSLVVSLTATPSMCAHLLKQHESHGRIYRASERAFNAVVGFYGRTLAVVLRFPATTLAVLLATIALNVYLYIHVPKGFFPQQDNGRMMGSIIADQDTSYQAMDKILRQMIGIITDDPAVDAVSGFCGGGGPGGGAINQARMFIMLKPPAQRKITADLVIARLRPKLAVVPGATLFMQSSQDIRVGGRFGAAQYQFTMQGDNLRDLQAYGPRMLEELRTIPLIVDVNTDQQNSGLQSYVQVDRSTAARFGISSQLVDNVLYDAFGEREVSTIYKPLNQYYVVMLVGRAFWQNPLFLRQVYAYAPNGQEVPLSAFSHFSSITAPLAVNHQGLSPSVMISFNLQPGVPLGDAAEAILARAAKVGLPSTIHTGFAGTAQAYQDSLSSEPLLIAAALASVYLVLGILYESYVHPVTILSTLPSAGVGALLALLLTRTELTVIAIIGIILLIGLVKKNAILMIDFALGAERNEGKSSRDSIYEACLLRFRPIMMTTMAAMLGAVPLALGTGMGSEFRRPLGIAIIGGLAVSQLLTLYTTPVVYLYFDRVQHWWWRHIGARRLEDDGSEITKY